MAGDPRVTRPCALCTAQNFPSEARRGERGVVCRSRRLAFVLCIVYRPLSFFVFVSRVSLVRVVSESRVSREDVCVACRVSRSTPYTTMTTVETHVERSRIK